MILYIAEKPSLARAIAAAFPKPQKKEEGCIWLANGDCISWCIGHLLEQAEPDAYNPIYKSWQLDHLPIVPQNWLWQEKSKTRKQLTVLKKLIKKAHNLVHAGDPDREGQLLVDEVIHYLKVPKTKQDTIQRLLINDLTPSAVKKSLSQLRSNKEFSALSRSALARARADWLHGINLTRAYTIKGKQGGYQGVLSIGRVQTPILGLVVKRDLERENFVAKDFYQVLAHITTKDQQVFKAKWIPSDACAPHMDNEGRVLNKALAENVIKRIHQQDALVTQSHYKKKRQAPPLPYSLSSLQIDAAKIYSMSAQQVLDSCQSLYEKHQLITYPRSDSRHLPSEQFKEVDKVISSLKANLSGWKEKLDKANSKQKSKAWNDKEVQAHHAIIPTAKQGNISNLSPSEKKLYELIARQYLMQFYPHYEYLDSFIELSIVGGLFQSKGHTSLEQGWKSLLPEKKSKTDEEVNLLPQVSKGDRLLCLQGELVAKVTTPPPAFTDASLLAAMTGISRYVKQADIKAILKETDGLGTEATRAGIIELLFRRQFLTRQGKNILATATGKALINSLPETLITPDMTARWEAGLNDICQGSGSYINFMADLESSLKRLIEQARETDVTAFSALPSPSKKTFKKKGNYRKKTYSKGTKKPKAN